MFVTHNFIGDILTSLPKTFLSGGKSILSVRFLKARKNMKLTSITLNYFKTTVEILNIPDINLILA